jgi:predicted nuclease of predicted toxin-antitoxin system
VRFLVDENLPRRFAVMLRDAGHDVDHVLDFDLGGRPDDDVFQLARREGYVVVTNDADFSTLAVLSGDALPSIVLFRDQRRRPDDLARLLLENLSGLESSLGEGAVAVFEPARVRVRSLPISED